jgi:hypothetical protein
MTFTKGVQTSIKVGKPFKSRGYPINIIEHLRESDSPKVERGFIMGIEHDLSVTDEVGVMRYQNIPLASCSESEDTNSVPMKIIELNLLLSFHHNVLANLMHELVLLFHRHPR